MVKVPGTLLATRDVDVPLSELGERQAQALGHWVTGSGSCRPPSSRRSCSPRLMCASTTASILLQHAGIDPAGIELATDERLREKEFGILDRLTRFGIIQKYPELHEQRNHVGKFYFRPPGGESWCDVILRLRSVIDTITREYRRERVLIVAHQVVVHCFRYLLENLDEELILSLDRADDVPNCGVTSYTFEAGYGKHGRMVPRLINFVAPLREAGTRVTTEPDPSAAPKP